MLSLRDGATIQGYCQVLAVCEVTGSFVCLSDHEQSDDARHGFRGLRVVATGVAAFRGIENQATESAATGRPTRRRFS